MALFTSVNKINLHDQRSNTTRDEYQYPFALEPAIGAGDLQIGDVNRVCTSSLYTLGYGYLSAQRNQFAER